VSRDDRKFIGALALTAALAGALIFSMQARERELETPASALDLSRIELELRAGRLSLHPAAFWEPMDESHPSGPASSGVSYDQRLIRGQLSRGALSAHEAAHWLPMEGVRP